MTQLHLHRSKWAHQWYIQSPKSFSIHPMLALFISFIFLVFFHLTLFPFCPIEKEERDIFPIQRNTTEKQKQHNNLFSRMLLLAELLIRYLRALSVLHKSVLSGLEKALNPKGNWLYRHIQVWFCRGWILLGTPPFQKSKFGWQWVVLGDISWYWVILEVTGWYWLILGGAGWYPVILADIVWY